LASGAFSLFRTSFFRGSSRCSPRFCIGYKGNTSHVTGCGEPAVRFCVRDRVVVIPALVLFCVAHGRLRVGQCCTLPPSRPIRIAMIAVAARPVLVQASHSGTVPGNNSTRELNCCGGNYEARSWSLPAHAQR
jgi:hypothetical protein